MMDIDGKPCSPRISEVFITIIIFLLAEGGLGACSFKSYSDKLYYQLLMLGVDHCYTKRSARALHVLPNKFLKTVLHMQLFWSWGLP